MKNKIIKIAFALVVFATVSFSCSDEFVDRDPVYSIDSENYFNSEADYNQALIAAYDLLQASYVNVLLGEIASDNTLSGGESANDVIGFQQVDEMTHTPVNSNLRDLWNWMFAGVNRANYILEFKDKTDFDGKGDERFKLGDEKTIPRSPVSEVYASMESDLQYAVANLAAVAPQTGRATKGAAQALLGKIYLYQNKFVDAANILQDVIDSNNYSLVSNYNTIFENSGENGPESVFEVQYSDGEGAGFGCLQCNGIRNYSGPLFDSGYSFNVPTQQAYDAYEVGDNRRDVAILNIVTFAAANNASYGTGYKHTGFFNRKYLPRQGDLNIGDQNLTNPNNYRAIRYADVLLMAAEAYNRGGINDNTARLYLNQVRRRAFGDTNHDISASGAALTDFILAERRFELMGEGHRFFDLVRTGRAAQSISGFTPNKNELFPIPIEEIQFSNGNWQQNPGY